MRGGELATGARRSTRQVPLICPAGLALLPGHRLLGDARLKLQLLDVQALGGGWAGHAAQRQAAACRRCALGHAGSLPVYCAATVQA